MDGIKDVAMYWETTGQYQMIIATGCFTASDQSAKMQTNAGIIGWILGD